MKTTARRERGFSIVELMVGAAVGLIGITIITHLYLTNEKYKRSTTGSGAAQVNGAIALYTVERDIRGAGYGVNHSSALSCTCTPSPCSPIQYHYNGVYSPMGAATALPILIPAPVVIASTAGTPDSITVLSSNDGEGAMPTTLAESMATPGAAFRLDGTAGYIQPGTAPPADSWSTPPGGYFVLVTQAGTCMLSRITNLVPASSSLEHSTASLWNSTTTLPTFSAGANVFNLGLNPIWRTYSVVTAANAYKLQVADVLRVIEGGAAQQIVDDLVDLQAEYGRDANNDGAIAATEWTATAPASAAEWQQVLAIRVGVLARSGNYEQPAVAGGACTATTVTPTWAGSIDPVTTLSKPESVFTIPGGLPSCYKYRAFETVIPLRNMIWRPA